MLFIVSQQIGNAIDIPKVPDQVLQIILIQSQN